MPLNQVIETRKEVMLWKQERQESVSTAFAGSLKLHDCFYYLNYSLSIFRTEIDSE